MRFAPTLIVLSLVAAACSASSSASTSTVSIDSVDVSGAQISIVVTADSVDPVDLAVAWGDGTSEPGVRGIGTFAFTHTYGADVTSATVSAQATASDGSVASDVASVELDSDASTTSLAALETTTTTSATTTTTTTIPPTTTTTQPPTTTTSTTTTTIPLPEIVEVELDISKGKIFDQWGGGFQETTWNGKTATATVTRHSNEWESDGIAVSFAIPGAAYEELKQASTALSFKFIAYPLADYVLDTDLSDGNAAQVRWEFMGTYDTTWSSNAKQVDIGEGFLTKGKSGEPMESSWVVDKSSFGVPQTVYLFFQCRARGPGGILVTSDSKCDASMIVNGITVTVIANR